MICLKLYILTYLCPVVHKMNDVCGSVMLQTVDTLLVFIQCCMRLSSSPSQGTNLVSLLLKSSAISNTSPRTITVAYPGLCS